ncbi:MAG: thioredoxin domain-containing protein [Nostocaceae cyanobacterium]|nr:thioredoxin domain-containing protein [Nostocaceae cyanobacterium]
MLGVKSWKTICTHVLKISRKTLVLIPLLLCLTLVPGTLPAQAVSRISPRLQEQVLQIIREHPDVIIQAVQTYQQEQQQKLQLARQAFLQNVQLNPKAVIGESPTTGASETKVLLVEFSDFQCPYCAQAHDTLKKFMAKHNDEVTLTYKHFPLSAIHPEAMNAAKASWAAHQQGKFWEYHDLLFTNQDKLGEKFYQEIAKKLDLDLEKFDRDRYIATTTIEQDMQLAQTLGLNGTPFFVMNGQTFSGALQLEEIENILANSR